MAIKKIFNFIKWAILVLAIVPVLIYLFGFSGILKQEKNQKLANAQFAANPPSTVQVVIDEIGNPFLLDDAGHVWAFLDPFNGMGPKEPVQLPKLEHIKSIEPYIALDDSGHVYTWSLDETLVWTTEDVIDRVGYTQPRKLQAVDGVSKISYSTNNFFAVKNNREIVMWQRLHGKNKFGVENTYEFSKEGPINTLYSGSSIKMIASTNENTWRKVNANAPPFGLVALLEDGSVKGWGINATGQLIGASDNQNIMLTQSAGATAVAINVFHTIVLNAQGIPQYWGGCDMYGLDKHGHPWQYEHLTGDKGNIDSVIAMAISKESSPITSVIKPEIFIKQDGSVWVAYAPSPKNTSIEACQQSWANRIDYLKPKKIMIGNARAIQIAAGDDIVLILDSNHKIWRFNLRYDDLKVPELKAKELYVSLRTTIQ